MTITIIGKDGFIGSNLMLRTINNGDKVYGFGNGYKHDAIRDKMGQSDVVYYVAGVNRPKNPWAFKTEITSFKKFVKSFIYAQRLSPNLKLKYLSSTQAGNKTAYGKTKELLENELHLTLNQNCFEINRITNVFGKYCKPNYNSAVTTMISELAKGNSFEPSGDDLLTLCYIDDVVDWLIDDVEIPTYERSFMQIYRQLLDFKNNKISISQRFSKLLHATYIHYKNITPSALTSYKDARGSFTMIHENHADKSTFSVNVINPNEMKGGHWHNTKTEIFTCIKGKIVITLEDVMNKDGEVKMVALNRFDKLEIPVGYLHSVFNYTEEEAMFTIWTNEFFNKNQQDTWTKTIVN